jgi:hypothetical protein
MSDFDQGNLLEWIRRLLSSDEDIDTLKTHIQLFIKAYQERLDNNPDMRIDALATITDVMGTDFNDALRVESILPTFFESLYSDSDDKYIALLQDVAGMPTLVSSQATNIGRIVQWALVNTPYTDQTAPLLRDVLIKLMDPAQQLNSVHGCSTEFVTVYAGACAKLISIMHAYEQITKRTIYPLPASLLATVQLTSGVWAPITITHLYHLVYTPSSEDTFALICAEQDNLELFELITTDIDLPDNFTRTVLQKQLAIAPDSTRIISYLLAQEHQRRAYFTKDLEDGVQSFLMGAQAKPYPVIFNLVFLTNGHLALPAPESLTHPAKFATTLIYHIQGANRDLHQTNCYRFMQELVRMGFITDTYLDKIVNDKTKLKLAETAGLY